jgi:pullulanase
MNQVAGTGYGTTGVAGTSYNADTQSYPGFPFGPGDFHPCTKSITDYTNQSEVQTCRLSGMSDVDTASSYVQDIDSTYIANLYRMGVVGFRIDAAKHINTADLSQIKNQTAAKLGIPASQIWWIQEVIAAYGEAAGIQPPNYYQNGDVNQFNFAYTMNNEFNGNIANIGPDVDNLNNDMPNQYANVFIANWDTERGTQTLNPQVGPKWSLAQAFMLGYDYGQPVLLSDYYFTNTDAGPAGATATRIPDTNMDTACAKPASKAGDWQCEQRWTDTRGMIGFHNAVAGTSVSGYWSDGQNNISFNRGSKGTLAINNTDASYTHTYSTGLPNGTYCNVYTTSNCSVTVTVSGGQFTATVAPRSAVALYAGAVKGSNLPTTKASNPKVDPSTPNYNSSSLTVYFTPSSDQAGYWGSAAQMYYGIDGTSTSATVQMSHNSNGWFSYTIFGTAGHSVQVAITNGSGWWVNAGQCPSSANFSIPAGSPNYVIRQNSSPNQNCGVGSVSAASPYSMPISPVGMGMTLLTPVTLPASSLGKAA